jgi:hypothetical protein
MPEEPESAGEPHPIIPTSEKAIGAIDLGLITGAAVIVAGLLVARWVKVRTASRLIGKTTRDGEAG